MGHVRLVGRRTVIGWETMPLHVAHKVSELLATITFVMLFTMLQLLLLLPLSERRGHSCLEWNSARQMCSYPTFLGVDTAALMSV